VRGVLVDKIRQEVEIDNFPGDYVTRRRDHHDENSHSKRPPKANSAAADIFTIGTDAKKDEQKGEHHAGVADNLSLVEANVANEQNGADHHQGHDAAGDKPKGQDDLFHCRKPPRVKVVKRWRD
jgi:hypothetical protein